MSTQNPAANSTADSAATANTIALRDANGASAFGALTAAAIVGASLSLTGDTLITATKTPSAANAAGVAGHWAWDADYVYICTATNTWKRVAIATWP